MSARVRNVENSWQDKQPFVKRFFFLFFGRGCSGGKERRKLDLLHLGASAVWSEISSQSFSKGERGHGQHYNSGFSSVPHNFLSWVFVVLRVLAMSYGIIQSITYSLIVPCHLVVFCFLQSVFLYNTNLGLLLKAVRVIHSHLYSI